MPEEATAAPPAAEEQAPSAPETPDESQQDEKPDGNNWLRETAQGLIYSRPLDTAKRSEEIDAANAELRRGRRNKQEDEAPSEGAKDGTPKEAEPRPSAREADDAEFNRRVQAEVDRREAVRRQRAETQYERELRQKDPAAYAKYKEQQEHQNTNAGALSNALRALSNEFDDAAVKPLMDALPDETRNGILSKASGVHGVAQRKVLVTEGVKALQKASYDEGFAKGKESAQKSLRRSSSFRKELLSELRGEEDEPENVLANGSPGGGDWDMNDWMRSMTGRRGR
jgi:hypothetical protein